MSADLVIRPARKADVSDIALLVNIATHGGIAQSWAADAASADTFDSIEVGRLRMLGEEEDLNWRNATMAEADGEIAGMLLGYCEPDPAQSPPADTPSFLVPILQLEAEAAGRWFISMLGVYVPWRGKGVGSVLLDAADRLQRETGARGQALIVEDVNKGARRLYERRGFEVRSSRPMGRFPGGGPDGDDWLLMVKE